MAPQRSQQLTPFHLLLNSSRPLRLLTCWSPPPDRKLLLRPNPRPRKTVHLCCLRHPAKTSQKGPRQGPLPRLHLCTDPVHLQLSLPSTRPPAPLQHLSRNARGPDLRRQLPPLPPPPTACPPPRNKTKQPARRRSSRRIKEPEQTVQITLSAGFWFQLTNCMLVTSH